MSSDFLRKKLLLVLKFFCDLPSRLEVTSVAIGYPVDGKATPALRVKLVSRINIHTR